MGKNDGKNMDEANVTILTTEDGTRYFVMGKVRIKVSEHFADDGRPLDDLLEDVIRYAGYFSRECKIKCVSYR